MSAIPTPPSRSDSGDAVCAAGVPVYDISYRDVFWRERTYEDRCDRLAIRALLPTAGGRLLDLGAGFGRLLDEYGRYERITLVDASPVMLAAARERAAGDPRIETVLATASNLPFPDASFDVVVAVRLLVHLADPSPVFREVRRVLRPGGRFIVEFPNRRHLLAVARYAAGRQRWSPTGQGPYEYREGHFAHQPRQIRSQLRAFGLDTDAVRAVSLFRVPWVKKHVPLRILLAIEGLLQAPLGPLYPGPSVYFRATRVDGVDVGLSDHDLDGGPSLPPRRRRLLGIPPAHAGRRTGPLSIR